jgi:RNA polymerase sigma factor (sigma-70 family)
VAANPTPARGDAPAGAFEELYRRHRGDVYRSVLRDVRNPADAEDVTQAAFLNAYKALRSGSEPEKPRAWLLTIAQNVTRRSFRMRASRPQEVELEAEAFAAREPEGPSAAEIREALARLRPNQRAALVLREIGGLSYAEIAEELELTVAAVETLLFRARRALREELEVAEERPVVRVGGLVVWPLSAALSEAVAPVTAWVGSRGLAAKAAGTVGAAIVGTGVAVQTGALPDVGAALPPAQTRTGAAVVPLGADGARAGRADAPKPTAERKKRSTGEGSRRAGGGAGETKAAASSDDGSGAGLVPELPVVGDEPVEAPGVSVPAVPEPDLSEPLPLEVPDVTVPEAELPALPEVELPALPEVEPTPLPEADELLP